MIGRAFLYSGLALISTSGLRTMIDLLRADPFDLWAAVLAAGCVLASIGLGMTGSKPWKRAKGFFADLGRKEE